MGNCQAIDAAALVIQHPSGKLERLYWPVAASEIMRMNPGHYVSLIIPLPPLSDQEDGDHRQKTVRFTRVKLLRPTDTLALGHAYRLVTSQEVMKVLRAKKNAKTKKQQQQEPVENLQSAEKEKHSFRTETEGQAKKHERHHRPRPPSSSSSTTKPAAISSKSWRPSLQSISEAGSTQAISNFTGE